MCSSCIYKKPYQKGWSLTDDRWPLAGSYRFLTVLILKINVLFDYNILAKERLPANGHRSSAIEANKEKPRPKSQGSYIGRSGAYSPHICSSPLSHFFTRSVVTDLGLSIAKPSARSQQRLARTPNARLTPNNTV